MPEILPPDKLALAGSGPVSFSMGWSIASPIQKVVFLLLSLGTVSSFTLFALEEFFSVRGVQGMLTSRVFLFIAWLFPTLWIWQIAWLTKSKKWRIASICVTVALSVAAVGLDRLFPMEGDSADAYSASAETFLPSELPQSLIDTHVWMTTQLNSELSKCPVSAFVYFRVVNRQSIAATIDQITVDVFSSSGWVETAHLDSRTWKYYWVSGGDFSTASEFTAPMLDTILSGRAVGPKETIRGWMPLLFPKTSVIFSPIFRFTIADTMGKKTTVVTERKEGENFTNAAITNRGKVDISKYRTVLIQDIPSYWMNVKSTP